MRLLPYTSVVGSQVRSLTLLWADGLAGDMAQPLVANGTLFVVTEDDMAYGLDPVTGAVRWGKKFGTPVSYTEITEGKEVCPDIKPHIGITSTPVIDTASNAIIAAIPVGKRPWNMAITPDGSKLYVACGRSNAIAVVDTATNAKIADIAVGALPWGVALR